MSFRLFIRRALGLKLDTILYRDDGQCLTIQVKDQVCRFFCKEHFFYREMFSNIGTIYLSQTKDIALGMVEKNTIHIRNYDKDTSVITLGHYNVHRTSPNAFKGVDPHAGTLVAKKDVVELLKRFKDMANKPHVQQEIQQTLEWYV